jgi:hypothetical protein
VIVNDLDVEGVCNFPAKADPPLIADADTVLHLALALQRFESVARWHPKIIESKRSMQVQQLPARRTLDRPKLQDAPVIEERFGSGIVK